MKTNKRGISLIVLVITIIVIIILAAAVILTLNSNNPINNSKQAAFDNDCDSIKSSMALFIGNFMAQDVNHDGPFSADATEVVIGDTNCVAPSKIVGTQRRANNEVSWADLGLSGKPSTVAEAKYNATTGKFTITPTNSDVKGKTDW